MSIIGNPIMAGASGPAASIFVTGLSETDTVTATNGSKTLTGKWGKKANPAVVPYEYTQLEYIESTGTQYINTGVIITGTSAKVVLDAVIESGSTFGAVYTSSPYNGFYTVSGSGAIGLNAGNDGQASFNIEYPSDKRVQISFEANNGTRIISYGDLTRSTSYVGSIITGTPLYLFARNYGNKILAKMKCYSCQFYTDGSLVRNFIPAKRNSDSVIGLYDLVNDVFYTNDGTGTFTAGPEIPQTIDGFLINPIRDFGTWTVTATDGSNIATQDVLVDVITEYEIEMSLSV